MSLCVVIPVYNEERRLERGARKLSAFLESHYQGSYELVIADNASTDTTPELGRRLAVELTRTRYVRMEAKGRGGALRRVWSETDAAVCAYMDVDLSTDLAVFPKLVEAVIEEGCGVAVASRLAPGARVQRGWRRETLSRGYNLLLRLALGLRVRDAQCGCKVVARLVIEGVLPHVENNHWFFDTELLALSERAGLRICELPARWEECTDSRVRVWATVREDLRGIARLRRRLALGEVGASPAAARRRAEGVA